MPPRQDTRLVGSLLLAATCLLWACPPTYQFTPPATPTGQACTMQCQASSDACRARKDREAQDCEWRKQEAQRALDRCHERTDDPMSCSIEVPLCYMANYNGCDIDYRRCYQACGGTVTEVKE